MAEEQTLDALNSITDEDWEEAIIEINAYALNKMKGRKLPENFTSEDYFQEAVTRLFEERRKWENKTKPDLIIHLKTIVKSLIYADIVSKHNINKEIISENSQSKLDMGKCNDSELNIDSAELYNEIEKAVNGDYDLEILILYLSEDQCKCRSEIAKDLEWTEEKLNNAIKRLRRKKDEILKEIQ